MEDIVPRLLKLIRKDFSDSFDKSELIAKLYAKARDGTATYLDANDYAIEIGKLLSEAYQSNLSSEILPDGHMYYNIANRIISPTMENNHELIIEMAAMVQSEINKEAGLGVKVIKPKVNHDRIKGIVEKIVATPQFDDVKWVLGESVVNFSQNVISDMVETNADFHYNSGVTGKIIRKSAGKCCEWCNRLVGVYIYPDVPKDVYRRHDFCRCTVDYKIGNKSDNVHNNNTGKRTYVKDEYGNYVKSEEVRIQRAKEMAATKVEREKAAREKRIETWNRKSQEKAIANEYVRRNGTNDIDIAYIHSENYRNKFSKITTNPDINEIIYKNAVSILTENNGTDTETVCIIDAKNGKTILRKRGKKDSLTVALKDKDLRIMRNHKNIIGMHNHPTNLPPNGSDYTAAGYRKYDFGVVVTHDGKVIKYNVGDIPFTPLALDARIDNYMGPGYNLDVNEAYIKALNEFRKEYHISWQELE